MWQITKSLIYFRMNWSILVATTGHNQDIYILHKIVSSLHNLLFCDHKIDKRKYNLNQFEIAME